MEIEVGDFVRTKNQGIKRIDTIFENKTVNKYGYEVGSDWDGKWYSYIKTTDIVKHSKQLIDLIEYRDLIKFKNPIKVSTIKSDKEKEMRFLDAQFCDGFTEYQGNEDTFIVYDVEYVINTKDIKNEDIDYILTHEQINQNCYRLEE